MTGRLKFLARKELKKTKIQKYKSKYKKVGEGRGLKEDGTWLGLQ